MQLVRIFSSPNTHVYARTCVCQGGPDFRAVPCCAVQAWDLAIGAAAGVASVLVSMPMDVIKTYMQTHGAGAAPGLGGQVAAFWQTGGVCCFRVGEFVLSYQGKLFRLLLSFVKQQLMQFMANTAEQP